MNVTYKDEVIPSLRKRFCYDFRTGLITRKFKNGRVSIYDGANHSNGYIVVSVVGAGTYKDGKPCKVRAHRLAWALHYGTWPDADKHIDHINGIKTDNRISNLRLVSATENNRNVGLKANNTSGVPGVSWRKDRNKWQVQICLNGKMMGLGMFKDKDVACEVALLAREAHNFQPKAA